MTDEPDKTCELSAGRHDTRELDGAQHVADFSADLRQMHEAAGKPSLRQMAMKVPYSHTALSNALRGVGGRLPSLELTLALVRACGGDEQAWRARWHQEHARITDHTATRKSSSGTTANEKDTRRAPRRFAKPLFVSVFGVALALVIGGVVITVIRTGASPNYGLGGGPAACEQSGPYNSCQIQQLAGQVLKDNTTPQQMKEDIARFSHYSAPLSGPWPFFIYDTIITPEDIGLVEGATLATIGQDAGVRVWTIPAKSGRQPIGRASLGSIVWVDCYVENDFHPQVPQDDDVGARWLRIRWPTTFISTEFVRSSLPTDQFVGYVYAGYTLPFTHNGKIPTCT